MNAQELVAPVAEDIRAMADDVERERQLPEKLRRRLTDAGLFSIYTPTRFGGMELPLPEALAVVEEAARHDGSTGWTIALGVANDLFTSILPDETAARVLGHGSTLIASAPGFGVRAERVAGGYRLSGQWSFCSGAPNADWMNVAAPVFEGGEPCLGPAGPEMIMAFMPPSDVTIVDTWYVTGLRGSGTQDLRVDDLFVPEAMTGRFGLPGGPAPVRPSTIARFPFFTIIALIQAPPVCLGVARHALEAFRELALEKERPFTGRLSEQVQAQVGLARAEALVRSARAYWYGEVQAAWDRVACGNELSLADRAGLRIASLTAAEQSTAAVDLLYRLAGSTAIFQASPLERCWRDVHTAAQHMQVQDCRWETAGRVLFGLEPGSPIV